MTAFLSNEPEPTAGSWFRLYVTFRRRGLTKSVEIKLPIDDWMLLHPAFSLVAKLVWCLPFCALTTYLDAQSMICDILWLGDAIIYKKQIKKMIPGETSSFPTPPPLLKKVQNVLALERLMRWETNRSEQLCLRLNLCFLNKHHQHTNGLLSCTVFEQTCHNKWSHKDSVLSSM